VPQNGNQLTDSDDINSRQQQDLTNDKHTEVKRLNNVPLRVAPFRSRKDKLLHFEVLDTRAHESPVLITARYQVQVPNRPLSNDLSEHLQMERGKDLPLCAVTVQDDHCKHQKSDDFD
jgi:hypothetical protein